MEVLFTTKLHRKALNLGLGYALWSVLLCSMMVLRISFDFLWAFGWVAWMLLGCFSLGMGLAVLISLLQKPHTFLESVLVLGLMGWAVALPIAVILGLPIW